MLVASIKEKWMVQSDSDSLRIFCLCGQKMRVSSAMFGKPGKCIACRQRIRVPRRDEVAAGTTELHLNEHPEFLRTRIGVPASEGQGREAEKEEIDLGEASRELDSIAMLPLYPLQFLFSCTVEIRRALAVLPSGNSDGDVQGRRQQLKKYRVEVREVRERLEDVLRSLLGESMEHLAQVKESLVRANLLFRVGDMSLEVYCAEVRRLRDRREALALRRQNLCGWLASDCARDAGGLVPVCFEDLGALPLTVRLDARGAASGSALRDLLLELEEGLERMENTAEQRQECLRMEREGGLSQEELETFREENEVAGRQSKGQVAFYRHRLQQVVQDSENDIRAMEAHLAWARRHFSEEAMAGEEEALSRYRSGLIDDIALVKQALGARKSEAVPLSVEDGVPVAEPTAYAMDSYLTWAASVMLILDVMALLQESASMNRVRGLSVFLLVMAAVLVAVGATRKGSYRAVAQWISWPLLVFAGVCYTKILQLGVDSRVLTPRTPGGWLFQPSTALFFVAVLFLFFGAWWSLIAARRFRISALVMTSLVFLLCVFLGMGSSPDARLSGRAAPSMVRAEVGGLPDSSVAENPVKPPRMGVPFPAAPEVVEAVPASNPVRVRMTGSLSDEEGSRFFRMEVIGLNGELSTRLVRLGERVFGPWKALEYNSGNDTLTMTDGKGFIILRVGEDAALD
jgi:hypothetical protein